MNMSPSTGKADPQYQRCLTLNTMIPNTSPQSQDLLQACLGFARQLFQSPGLYCRLEVKIGDESFNFQTGSPEKEKVPATTGSTEWNISRFIISSMQKNMVKTFILSHKDTSVGGIWDFYR